MRETIKNKKGAILVFVLIINAIIIFAFTVLLSSVVMDWKMKKVNSGMKKEFYYAEAGLDEAYVMTLEYLSTVLDFFYEKNKKTNGDDEYIYNEFKDIVKGTSDAFDNNVGLIEMLTDTENYLINNEKLIIDAKLKENQNDFLLEIRSGYKTGEVLNKLALSCKIIIPISDTGLEYITPESLIIDKYWFIER